MCSKDIYKLTQRQYEDALLKLSFDSQCCSKKSSRKPCNKSFNIPHDKQQLRRDNRQCVQFDVIPSPRILTTKQSNDEWIKYFDFEIFREEQNPSNNTLVNVYSEDWEKLKHQTVTENHLTTKNKRKRPRKMSKNKSNPDQKPKKKRIRKDCHNFSVQNRSTGLNRINKILRQNKEKKFSIEDFKTFLKKNSAFNSQLFLVYTYIFLKNKVPKNFFSLFKVEMCQYYKKRLAKKMDKDKIKALLKKIFPNIMLLNYLFSPFENIQVEFQMIKEICEYLLLQPRETNRQAINHLDDPLERIEQLYDQQC